MMINKKSSFSLFFPLSILLFVSVSCDPNARFEKEEREQIDFYLTTNPLLNFQLQPSGLYYLEIVTGTGPAPVTYDSVFVFYTGKYLDGTIFGSNVASGVLYGFRANCSDNIAGFDEGIMKMKQGGKSTILVPSYLGYGETGNAWIPGFQPLLFDLEIVRIKPSSGK